jgi:hypothetical protein
VGTAEAVRIRELEQEVRELASGQRHPRSDSECPFHSGSAAGADDAVDAESLLLLEVAGCGFGGRPEDLVHVELPVQGEV